MNLNRSKRFWFGCCTHKHHNFIISRQNVSPSFLLPSVLQNGTRDKYTHNTHTRCTQFMHMWLQSSAQNWQASHVKMMVWWQRCEAIFPSSDRENGVYVLNIYIILLTRVRSTFSSAAAALAVVSKRKAINSICIGNFALLPGQSRVPRFSLFITNRTAINVPLITMNIAL